MQCLPVQGVHQKGLGDWRRNLGGNHRVHLTEMGRPGGGIVLKNENGQHLRVIFGNDEKHWFCAITVYAC